jgi:hypothetical protein
MHLLRLSFLLGLTGMASAALTTCNADKYVVEHASTH